MRVRIHNRVLVASAFLTTAALIAACGSDDSPNARHAQPSTATVVDRVPVHAARPDQVLRYTAKEYAFVGPRTAPAGLTELVLTNTGLEDHQLALFRLNDGVDAGTALGAVGSKGLDAGLQYGHYVAGPNGTGPKTTTSVVADLQPGKYVVFCGIPDASGKPHAMQGMLTDLTVTAATKPATKEVAGLPRVHLGDYHFELPKGFDGSGPVVVVNDGKVVHEAVVARIRDGKTVADVIEYEQHPYPRRGAAPYTLVTGTTFIDPGGAARVDLDLAPGKYAWLCFLPGPKQAPHLALGMAHPFTVS